MAKRPNPSITKIGLSDKLCEEYSSKLNAYLTRYNLPNGCDMLSAFNLIKDSAYKKSAAQEAVLRIQNQLKEFEGVKEEFSLPTDNLQNLDELKAKLKLVQDEYSSKATALASKKASLTFHEQLDSEIVDLENKKAELLSKLEEYESEYKILLLTIEYLNKADESLKIKYRAPLQQSLDKYLAHIDKNSKAFIDVDLVVTVDEQTGQKSTEYYSKGYQNLFEICKRFALTDVLFTNEKPFIILDDPFYNLDDNKLTASLELIKKLSLEYQIIYLVCHESRMPK